MPEAAMDEYRQSSPWVTDIRAARDSLNGEAISGHALGTQGFPQEHFGLRITSLVGPHDYGNRL